MYYTTDITYYTRTMHHVYNVLCTICTTLLWVFMMMLSYYNYDNAGYIAVEQLATDKNKQSFKTHINIQNNFSEYLILYPTKDKNTNMADIFILVGLWSFFSFDFMFIVVGVIGNVFTVVAVPYGKRKQRHNWRQLLSLFVLNLCVTNMTYCVFTLIHLSYGSLLYFKNNLIETAEALYKFFVLEIRLLFMNGVLF